VILYHFTIERYVDSIREHGILSIAEKRRRGMYPAGWEPAPESWDTENETVWLTSDPDSNAGIVGMEPVYRVTVDVDNAIKWYAYMAAKHIPGNIRRGLRVAALALSPTNRDVNWYLTEETIPPDRITSIDLYTKEQVNA
jgi:hypothetical protein